MENSDAQLIPFLRELANSIESNKLSQEQLKHCGEFFMSYKFHEESSKQSETDDDEDFSDMDVIRFISLGWYMYRIIANTNNPTGPVGPC